VCTPLSGKKINLLQAATEALRQANISGKRQLDIHTDSKFLQDSATKVNSLFILIVLGIRIRRIRMFLASRIRIH
jgi:hypothetical protein